MREIEFRGRDKNSDGTFAPWVYGGYSHADICPEIIDGQGIEQCVEPDTVGQYTGLKDKHGVKIYEGDVVKFSWLRGFTIVESLQVVRFCKDGAAFKFWDGQSWCPFWGFIDEDMEVAGNIFDNPEFDKQFGEVYRKEQ